MRGPQQLREKQVDETSNLSYNKDAPIYQKQEKLLAFSNFEEANNKIFQNYFSSNSENNKKIKFSEKEMWNYFKELEKSRDTILKQLDKNNKYLNLIKKQVWEKL